MILKYTMLRISIFVLWTVNLILLSLIPELINNSVVSSLTYFTVILVLSIIPSFFIRHFLMKSLVACIVAKDINLYERLENRLFTITRNSYIFPLVIFLLSAFMLFDKEVNTADFDYFNEYGFILGLTIVTAGAAIYKRLYPMIVDFAVIIASKSDDETERQLKIQPKKGIVKSNFETIGKTNKDSKINLTKEVNLEKSNNIIDQPGHFILKDSTKNAKSNKTGKDMSTAKYLVCIECKNPVSYGSSFCPNCGFKIDEE